MIRVLLTCAALVAALAVAAPSAHAAANCGTMRKTIDGVASVTRVSVLGTGCGKARKVASKALAGAFPETVKVDSQRWRLFDSHATSRTFRASYKSGKAVVGLSTRYKS